MRPGPFRILSSVALIAAAIPALAHPHSRRGPTTPHSFRSRSAARPAASSPPARSGIRAERATQIQAALIKQGYLTGTPSGTWDKESQDAMEKMQSDNGWQTKLVPDSRAIIKLGLGPSAANQGEPEGTEATAHSSEGAATLPSEQ